MLRKRLTKPPPNVPAVCSIFNPKLDRNSNKNPASEPIESTFQRLLPGPDPAKSTEIEIVLAHIAVDLESCCVQVSWPDDNTPTKKALISDIIFKSGKMKHCYKVLSLLLQYTLRV